MRLCGRSREHVVFSAPTARFHVRQFRPGPPARFSEARGTKNIRGAPGVRRIECDLFCCAARRPPQTRVTPLIFQSCTFADLDSGFCYNTQMMLVSAITWSSRFYACVAPRTIFAAANCSESELSVFAQSRHIAVIHGQFGKSPFDRECVVGLGGLEPPTKRLSAASSEH